MSTPFQSAMHDFAQASVEHASKERCARFEGGPTIGELAESERNPRGGQGHYVPPPAED